MLVDVKVPMLAESIAEATLLNWIKKPGDTVNRGDNLIEIETDKVVLEVPAPEDGLFKQVLVEDGATVQGGDVIAVIDTDYAAGSTEYQAEPPHIVPKKTEDSAPPALSPAVRRMLMEHEVDPELIAGSGRDGRILKADVVAHLQAAAAPQPPRPAAAAPTTTPAQPPAPAPAPSAEGAPRGERREPMSRLRVRVAERLVQAQQNAAILTTFNEVDMQPIMDLRRRYRDAFEQAHGVRLGFMSFFAKASVLALRRFAMVNAYIDGPDIVHHDYYDIGIAVGSPRGLLVPVLRDVDTLAFADIERQIGEFGRRAADGKINPQDLMGGTFTITNGGVFGSLLSTPILNPPQSAILGMHKIQERPMALDGQVVIRPMMYLALSYDHRIVDGREAVQFLVAVKEALEDPARMLLQL